MHTGPGAERGLSWPIAAVLTFLAAASVLVLEIAAGRLLAPYVGVSLTTYTGIIGAILAGIALGAWLGGLAADAFGPRTLLGPTFVLGGLAAIAAVPIVGAVGGVGSATASWRSSSSPRSHSSRRPPSCPRWRR